MKHPQPKVLMTWREPRGVRRARGALEAKGRPSWKRPAAVGGIVLATWLIASLIGPPGTDRGPYGHWGPYLAFLVMLGLAILLVYMVPLVERLGGCEITITEKGIVRASATAVRRWDFGDIESCAILTREIGGGEVSVLAVRRKGALSRESKGASWAAGIAPEVDVAKLRAILMEQGVQIARPGLQSGPGGAGRKRPGEDAGPT